MFSKGLESLIRMNHPSLLSSRGGYTMKLFMFHGTVQMLRPLRNVQFCSTPRKAKILTTPVRSAGPTGQAGIPGVFRGLKFEPDAGIGQKGTF